LIASLPHCQPNGSVKKKKWYDVTPQCQSNGSEKKEGWRKKNYEGNLIKIRKDYNEKVKEYLELNNGVIPFIPISSKQQKNSE
jgi:hypothetical protein